MEKIQKSLISNGITVKVFSDSDLEESPSFCPVCNFVMSSHDDFEYFEKFSCCSFCAMKFAQSRKKEWSEGWRPEKQEIEDFKNSLRLQSPPFTLD